MRTFAGSRISTTFNISQFYCGICNVLKSYNLKIGNETQNHKEFWRAANLGCRNAALNIYFSNSRQIGEANTIHPQVFIMYTINTIKTRALIILPIVIVTGRSGKLWAISGQK